MFFDKSIDLVKLQSEAISIGILFPRGLGTSGDQIFTYDEKGNSIEPPLEFQAVLDAHSDTREAEEINDNNERTQIENVKDTLSAYINLESPNGAQTVAVVKILCRAILYIVKKKII